jgi:pimeloyl-ACP methyl ester carboxylesterase
VPAVYAQDVSALMNRLEIPRAVFIGTSMGGIITMVMAAYEPDRVAAAVLNDVGPKLNPLGLARIASYVGHVRAFASWEEAAAGLRERVGNAYPECADDNRFWLDFARRACRQREDGRIEPDYDPRIALPFMEAADAPPADLTPLFMALAQKPVLLVRGEISDLCGADVAEEMRQLKPDLAYVEVPRVGHAPCMDEPDAWEGLLDFLARVE